MVVAAEIAAGAWAYSNANELNDLVKVNFRKIVEEDYGIISSRTEVVDTIQEQVCITQFATKLKFFIILFMLPLFIYLLLLFSQFF